MADADYIYAVEIAIGDDDALREWARIALPEFATGPIPSVERILDAAASPDCGLVLLGNRGNWSVLDFG